MTDDEERWAILIDGLRAGDRDASRIFCEQYGVLLERVAAKHLPAGLRRRVGTDDVVQSVCRTFLRRTQEGEFRLDDSQRLWSLLCAITLTKIREQTRFHLRLKRGLAQEFAFSPEESGAPRFDPRDPDQSPHDAAAFADQFQHLLSRLDNEERQVLDLKLQDLTNEQVAEMLGCSERTIRRIVKRVQEQLIREFDLPYAPRRNSD